MEKLSTLVNHFNELWPESEVAEWDRSGLMIGNLSSEIQTVFLTVDVTMNVLMHAKDSGANLVLSHHPMFLSGAHTLREDLARIEEDLITQQQQNEYMAERIQELESQLASAEDDRVNAADLANMEERLRQQRLASEAAEKTSTKPWYSGFTAWLIGLLVLGAGVGSWFLYRRRVENEFLVAQDEEQLREIKDEAEEVLRVLEDSADEDQKDGGEADDGEPETVIDERTQIQQFGSLDDDAEVLDEESSDPEIQLDLARAYISMGDKEAARVILEEVVFNGSDAQQTDAQKMLDLLSS